MTPHPLDPTERRCWTCRLSRSWVSAGLYRAEGECPTRGRVGPNDGQKCPDWGMSPCAGSPDRVEFNLMPGRARLTVRRDGSPGGSLSLSPHPSPQEGKAL